ncbi:MAG TPA: cupin domain-containing protein [Desulfatiglandales bacterium]|nr:cupin domain-containing protein [Desulfatiglandales bacterium]
MEYKPINLKAKLATFSDHWSPKIIAQMNDYHFKLVKFQGDFIWHSHDDTDEVFIALEGDMSIEFHDGKVDLNAGELFLLSLKEWNTSHMPKRNARSCLLNLQALSILGMHRVV